MITLPPLNIFGQAQKNLTALINQFKNEMVLVAGDTFTMGCNEADNNCLVMEKPAHAIRLDSFFIAEYDVTQWQWQTLMGSNPSHFKHCNDCPVETVSWDEVQKFITKLNQVSGAHYRLPTEAEWEFAARGGRKSNGFVYAGSNQLDSVAWFNNNSKDSTHPVSQKQPNELGLYDMSGNVWQWCNDWYEDKYYSISPDYNPQGPDNGQYRAVRGSAYSNIAKFNRITLRRRLEPFRADSHGGFRLAEDFKYYQSLY